MDKRILFVVAALCLGQSFADAVPSFSSKCFVINGTISFNISYMGTDDKIRYEETSLSNQAKLDKFNCDNKTGPIYAQIMDGSKALYIYFSANTSKDKMQAIEPGHWGINKITYNYEVINTEAKTKGARLGTAEGAFFVTPNGKAYSCSKESVSLNVTLLNNGTATPLNDTVLVEIEHLVLDGGPNLVVNGTEYDYHYCKADQKVKDIVPIAVGVALAALVVIVLVAYLIGRRRTVASGGYERV